MNKEAISRLKVRKIEAEMNFKMIMDHPDRVEIDYRIIAEAMYRLDVVDKELMDLGYVHLGDYR